MSIIRFMQLVPQLKLCSSSSLLSLSPSLPSWADEPLPRAFASPCLWRCFSAVADELCVVDNGTVVEDVVELVLRPPNDGEAANDVAGELPEADAELELEDEDEDAARDS